MHIGKIIRRLRKEKKMTLLELSQKSGVAIATLSRMETGKMTGPLKSHMAISKALEIPLIELYEDLTKKAIEVRTKKKVGGEIFVYNKATSYEMLVSNALNKKMMPIGIRINEGGITQKETSKPSIEKFIYVACGKIEVVIGEEKHTITKGDTLYFESSLPHYFKNIGKGESYLICVVCPPSI